MILGPICAHARKAVCTSPTTNYPPPAIVCLDCWTTIITIEEAKRLIDAALPAAPEVRGTFTPADTQKQEPT